MFKTCFIDKLEVVLKIVNCFKNNAVYTVASQEKKNKAETVRKRDRVRT